MGKRAGRKRICDRESKEEGKKSRRDLATRGMESAQRKSPETQKQTPPFRKGAAPFGQREHGGSDAILRCSSSRYVDGSPPPDNRKRRRRPSPGPALRSSKKESGGNSGLPKTNAGAGGESIEAVAGGGIDPRAACGGGS
ncbi:hypothetical protein ZWY2020_039008 [Hordeum vulgare]|nr:hypothetical protein ZWY2020_039008 [Hordeum vulgare]